MKKTGFVDANNRPIRNGSRVYFSGIFPKSMPIFEQWMYDRYNIKHPREGIALFHNNQLVFATYIKGQLMTTGLTWEQDGKPCFDLQLTNVPLIDRIFH